MAAILTVTDHAVPYAGLFHQSWDIECPFEGPEDPNGFENWDYIVFKATIIAAYSEFSDGKVTAAYEWENIELLNPETPCT